MALPVLYQLMASHRCEAARWILDHHARPYVVRSLLWGPHLAQIVGLTRQTEVPVLVRDGTAVAKTGPIAVALEAGAERRLLPTAAAERAEMLKAVEELDRDLGRPLETLWLSAVLEAPDFAAALFAIGRGPTRRRLYRTLFPAIRTALVAQHRLSDRAHLQREKVRVTLGLDRLSALVAAPPAAGLDLLAICAASAVSWLVPGAVSPYKMPAQEPPTLTELQGELRSHDVIRWAAGIYDRYRGVSLAENHEIEGSGVL